jgi:uncharacterized protein
VPDDRSDAPPLDDDQHHDATGAAEPPAVVMTDRMRRDLTTAMRERDKVQVRALRATLAAIANAEAPPPETDPRSTADEPVVGELVEHRRLDLSAADLERVLRAEIADRDDTIERFRAVGRTDEADEIRRERSVIERYV